jgi:hypothetical protein
MNLNSYVYLGNSTCSDRDKDFKTNLSHTTLMGKIKNNDMREACNMQGKMRTAYEVNSDNLQRKKKQLVDLPPDDKKKG